MAVAIVIQNEVNAILNFIFVSLAASTGNSPPRRRPRWRQACEARSWSEHPRVGAGEYCTTTPEDGSRSARQPSTPGVCGLALASVRGVTLNTDGHPQPAHVLPVT